MGSFLADQSAKRTGQSVVSGVTPLRLKHTKDVFCPNGLGVVDYYDLSHEHEVLILLNW